MSDFEKRDSVIDEAELIVAESELKDTINRGLKICCPNCHSPDYEPYPTGQLNPTITFPEEDIHYACLKCRYIWNSEFCGDRYNHRRSNLTGQFKTAYKISWFKKWYPEITWGLAICMLIYVLMRR